MKIVIDIPDGIYKKYMDDRTHVTDVLHAVRHGTPLPEHHGRLIDADSLEYTCNADECGMLTGCNHCQHHIVTEHEIDNAPTIIEGSEN